MRRIVLLTAVAVMAITAVAYAVTDTVSYTSKMSYKGKPTKKKPANLAYNGILDVGTDPAGQQPEIAPRTTIYFSKAIKNNASHFPFCNQSEIDGAQTFPKKCIKAIVGGGTATALAGSAPGISTSSSAREDLKVKAVNGPRGKHLYLVLNSTPTAPVAIQNRVIPGTLIKAAGTFGFVVRFDVPRDLQTQAGLSVSLTDFNVKISGKPRTVKVGTAKKSLAYLQLTACKGHLPVKAIVNFKDANTGKLHPVTDTSAAKC